MKMGSALPMPKMNSARGIQAIPEIGRSNSMTGSTMSSSVRRKPIRRPSGIARSEASAKLIIMRPRLMPACTNSSKSRARSTIASITANGVGSSTRFDVQTDTAHHTAMKTAIVRT